MTEAEMIDALQKSAKGVNRTLECNKDGTWLLRAGDYGDQCRDLAEVESRLRRLYERRTR